MWGWRVYCVLTVVALFTSTSIVRLITGDQSVHAQDRCRHNIYPFKTVYQLWILRGTRTWLSCEKKHEGFDVSAWQKCVQDSSEQIRFYSCLVFWIQLEVHVLLRLFSLKSKILDKNWSLIWIILHLNLMAQNNDFIQLNWWSSADSALTCLNSLVFTVGGTAPIRRKINVCLCFESCVRRELNLQTKKDKGDQRSMAKNRRRGNNQEF